MERIAPFAPVAVGAVLAMPLLVFRYPPMGDLAMHEAVVGLVRHHGDPAWMPPDLYRIVAPQANQLFHFAAAALAYLTSTSGACVLVVAITLGALPFLTARWLGHLGLSRWPAALVAPIAYGWMFRWGLVANILGTAGLLASLPLIERLSRRPTPARAAAATGAVVLVFFAHESSALVVALFAGYLLLVRAGRQRAIALRGAPIVAALVLAFVQARANAALAGANMRLIGSDYGPGAVARLTTLLGGLFGDDGSTRAIAYGLVTVVAVAACVRAKVRSGRGHSATSIPMRIALARHRHAVVASVLFVLYLTFPMSAFGNTLLANRFLPPAFLFLVAACAPRASRRDLTSVVLPSVVPVVVVVFAWPSFQEADATYRALDAIIAYVPRNVAVAQLDLTPNMPATFVPGPPSRIQAERGGRMLFALTDMPPNPIMTKPRARWDEPILRLAHEPFAFLPAHDARHFGWVVVRVRGKYARYRADVATAMTPELVLVTSSGEWDLYRSTGDVVPLDAPDEPPPQPLPETLGARINRVRGRE